MRIEGKKLKRSLKISELKIQNLESKTTLIQNEVERMESENLKFEQENENQKELQKEESEI